MSIKNTIVSLADSVYSYKTKINIGDIYLKRKEITKSQFLITTRYMDIERYINDGDDTFYYQNAISRLTYGERHLEQRGNDEFTALIESFKINGYNGSTIILDNNFYLLNGNHRLGACLYFGYNELNACIPRRSIPSNNDISDYRKLGLSEDYLNTVIDKHAELENKLFENGNSFCLLSAEEIDLPNSDYNLSATNRISCPGEYKYMYRFSLPSPDYYVKNGNLHSKTIDSLSADIKKTGNDSFAVSNNCLEGFKMFERNKQFIEE